MTEVKESTVNVTSVEAASVDDATKAHLDLIEQRRIKLQHLRDKGVAFRNDFRREHLAGDLQNRYQEYNKEQLASENIQVSVAGRVMLNRGAFLVLQDMTGRIQLYVNRKALSAEQLAEIKSWDLGDVVGVMGVLHRSNKGDLYIEMVTVVLLTKALRPLPEKFQGLKDTEIKYRQRYLDLIVNESTRSVFQLRSALISEVRQFFAEHQFIEVETPMMQALPGGATAKPFLTHHNALNMPLFLRIAPELYLKRLVVGGFERVFEINRNFRNEGLSTRHNPEFTMLEFYQAFADYQMLMAVTETLFKRLAFKLLGTGEVQYQGKTYDFANAFQRMTVVEALRAYQTLVADGDLHNESVLRSALASLSIKMSDECGIGKLQMTLFEEQVEAQLEGPIFITEYPTEVSPLARKNDNNPLVTDRFELFIAGREIANGFSELNDAEDQAARFKQQVAEKEAGDDEAMHFDEDYICALEHGLPPTAGEGIGIDRLVMLFADAPSIRDVILFPHMRPKG